MTIKEATSIAGTLGYPSKMPGTSYGISARACKIGGILAKIKGSVCHGCYALKGNYLYPDLKKSHTKRLASIANPSWTMAMVTLLTKAHKRGTGRNGKFSKGWHRWHDSGDLQSVEHLTKICAVCALTPDINHWLPTREHTIVKAYISQGGVTPRNLVVRISATMVDGPATTHWLHTSGVHDKVLPPTESHVCPAPQQEGKCGPCRACWSHDVKHTSYHKH
jgi:hypothetical protein